MDPAPTIDGQRLATIRRRVRNMSRASLGRAVWPDAPTDNAASQRIRKIETGGHQPPVDVVERISSALGVRVADLLPDSGGRRDPPGCPDTDPVGDLITMAALAHRSGDAPLLRVVVGRLVAAVGQQGLTE